MWGTLIRKIYLFLLDINFFICLVIFLNQMKVLCDIVQVFRSIDSNSVKGFPKDPKDGTKRVSRKARFLSIKFSWFKYLFPVNGLIAIFGTELGMWEKCLDRYEHTYSVHKGHSCSPTFHIHRESVLHWVLV